MSIVNIPSEMQIKQQIADSASKLSQSQTDIKETMPQNVRLNLFDSKATFDNFVLSSSNGSELVALENTSTTDYIPVDIHFGNILYSTSTFSRYYRYDVNRKPIDSTSLSGAQIALTPDVKFIRCSFGTSVKNSLRISYAEALGYPYYNYEKNTPILVDDEKPIDKSVFDKNLVNKETISFGYYLNNSNTLVSFANGAVTDYIPVSKKVSTKLKIKLYVGNSNKTTINGLYFYDAQFRMLSYQRTTISIANGIEILEGAAYVRIQTEYDTTDKYYIVIKYDCFKIDWWDLLQYKKPFGINLFDKKDYIEGFEINNGVINRTVGKKMSTLIPVLPNTRYFFNPNVLFLYDAKRKYINKVVGGFYYLTTPSDCHYVAFNVPDNIISYSYFYGIVEVDNLGEVGRIVKEDENVKVSITFDEPPFTRCSFVMGIMENNIVLSQSYPSNTLVYLPNGYSGKYYELNMNNLLPNKATNESVEHVLFFYSKSQHSVPRALIFGNKNSLWCSCLAPAYDNSHTYNTDDICSYSGSNYWCLEDSVTGTWDASKWENRGSVFSYFEQCNIWDLKGNHHWRIADDDKDPTGERYRMYYPSGRTESQNRFMWHDGPVWIDCGGQYAKGVMFGNYSNSYRTALTEPPCVFYTENGKDVYVMYEFGLTPRWFKYGGSQTLITNTNASEIQCGEVVDFTGFSGTQSYSIKKRTTIVPSATEKDPTAIFEYGNEINVTGVNGTIITLSDASSLSVRDTIVLVGTATGDYAKLLTDNIDSTTGIPNGNVFVISAKSGNNITISDSIGNPKNNLFCRHIHGLSNFGQGVVVYTGEEYPEGWMVYISPYMENDELYGNVNNNRWFNDVVRLNSTSTSQQKSLGMYLRPDGKILTASDSVSPYVTRMQVRGKDIKMVNMGLVKFELENIDDATKSELLIPNSNCGYALFKLGHLLFYSDYYGNTYYSIDEGDSWKFIYQGSGTKSIIRGWDKNARRYYFDGANNNQCIIELK